jgi:hypothetical protein
MALTYSNFTTFADVARWYETTTPLRGKDNVGKDIRPIGDRKRKYERIVKVSDNCYALSDGWHYGDDVFKAWYRNAEYTPTSKDMEFYAPIVWRKHKDGTETVTMRNGSGSGAHNMRYAFLYRHSPRGLRFRNHNGKHFIQAGVKEYFLAKGTTVPKPVWEDVQREIAVAKANGRKPQRWLSGLRAKNDNASLTFKLVEGSWQHVDGGRDVPTPPKKRVNKELKAKLKPHIEAFRDWVLAVGPMLPLGDWSYDRQLRDAAVEWSKGTGYPIRDTWSLSVMLDATLSRKIITDAEHPLRMQLAFVALTQAELLRVCRDQDDVVGVKTAFNRWVNKQLGLVKEVKE